MRPTITWRDIPDCRRCGQPGVLHVSYPTTTVATGTPGHLEHVLCKHCDTDPAAVSVVVAAAAPSTGRQYEEDLITAITIWIETLRTRRPTPGQLDRDADAYFSGDPGDL